MKVCPICRSTYEEWIDFCFNDGMPLVEQDSASAAHPAGDASTAPVPAEPAPAPAEPAPRPTPADPVTRPVPFGEPPERSFAAAPTMVPLDPESRPRPALAPGFDDDEFSAPEPGLLKRGPAPAGEADPTTAPEPAGVFDVHIGGASPFDVQPASGDAPTAPVPAFLPPPRGAPLPLSPPAPAPPLVAPPPPPSFSMPAPAGGLHPGLPAAAPTAEAPPLRPPAPASDLWAAQTLPDPAEVDEPAGGMDDAAMGEVAAVLGAGADRAEPPSNPTPLPTRRPEPVPAREEDSAPRPPAPPVAADPFAEPPPAPAPRFGMLWVGMAAGVAVTGVIALLIVGLGDKEGTAPPPATPIATPATPPPSRPPPAPAEALSAPTGADPADAGALTGTPLATAPAAGSTAPTAGSTAPVAGSTATTAGATTTGATAKPPTTAAGTAATSSATRPTTTTTSATGGTTTRPTSAAVAPAARGRLQIITEPDGAAVYVDDAMWGTSPVQRELAFGEYTVRVQLAGHKTESRTITLGEANKTVPFKLRADVATGQVNIFGPTGHTVSVDGRSYGTSPVMAQLSEGLHQFALTAPDGSSCTIPRSVAFTATGKPLTVTLQCP